VVPDLLNWSSATRLTTPYRFANGEDVIDVEVTPASGNQYEVISNEQTMLIVVSEIVDGVATLEIDGKRQRVSFHRPVIDEPGARLQLSIDGRDLDLTNVHAIIAPAAEVVGAGSVIAPMHGMLLEVFVVEGQTVARGDRLAVVEAMKMQHELIAGVGGEVTAIHFEAGSQVAAEVLLMEITVEQQGGLWEEHS
jgi:geranyl-CoA carboxylase alpha subunit